jgi:hypothetical protein
MDTPEGWRVTAPDAGQAGRVRASGPAGEQVVVWPLSLPGTDLSPGAANQLVARLARVIEPGVAWAAVQSAVPGYVRVASRGGAREGVTVMAWQKAAGGTAACVYSLMAARGAYDTAAGVFEKMVSSFRLEKAPDPAPRAAEHPAGVSRFVTWSDQREGAFSTSVPEGWTIVGGAYRFSATDVRQAVTAVSPDGAVRVSVGDANQGAFTVPTQMHAMVGLREGAMTSLGDGSMLQIMRFVPGPAFIRHYVDRVLRPACGGRLDIVGGGERGDLAGQFFGEARAEGIPNPQVSAGVVSFTCTVNGHPMVGYYAAATIIPLPGTGPLWYVYRLYGFVAPPDRRQEGEDVCRRMLQSWQISPAWRERERQIAAQAVYQDNLRSQQVRARALAAIAEDLRQTSEIVSSSYWQRQAVYDEISRKRENAILGTVDVVDPTTGTQYKIGYNADYHWMDSQGNILGTLTHTSPGVGWRQMIDLK